MLADYYLSLKALHLLAMIAWMAGLLYLPRLFIYHLGFDVKSEAYATFCKMEQRLLKIIMLPAIILTFTFGILLAFAVGAWASGWFHLKLFFALILAAFHGYLSRLAKAFLHGKPPSILKNMPKLGLFLLNELPFLLAIFIVFLAVFKPF